MKQLGDCREILGFESRGYPPSMKKQELVDLEVERRALLATVKEMSKGCDARMETSFDEFLTGLEDRAREIQEIIDREKDNVEENIEP